MTLRSFGVFIDTGARLSEVSDLKTADIDLDDQTLTVTGKGSRVRVLPIGAKSVKAIDRYLRVQRSDLPALWIGPHPAPKGKQRRGGCGRRHRRPPTGTHSPLSGRGVRRGGTRFLHEDGLPNRPNRWNEAGVHRPNG